jgi:hypothetical protein
MRVLNSLFNVMRHSMHILNQKQKAAVNIVDIYALSLSRKDILGILAYRVTKYSELRAIGGTVVLFEIQRNCTSRIVYSTRKFEYLYRLDSLFVENART